MQRLPHRTLRSLQLNHYKHVDRKIKVSLPTCEAEVKDWLDEHIYSTKTEVVGFDSEWAPSYTRGEYNPVSLVQLATPEAALLVQCNAFGKNNHRHLPHDMVKLIQSDEIMKVGVGVFEDILKVSHDYHFSLGNSAWTDIGSAAQRTKVTDSSGLRTLTEKLFDTTISKPKSIQRSNWARRVLSMKQIKYAAFDALMSVDVYWALHAKSTFDILAQRTISDEYLYSENRIVSNRIEGLVYGRSECRKLWLHSSESSASLRRAASALRMADAKVLAEIHAAKPPADNMKELTGNSQAKTKNVWRTVLQVLLSRFGSQGNFIRSEMSNSQNGVTVQIVVNCSILFEATGRTKATAAEIASWQACMDILQWQLDQQDLEWFNACAGKGRESKLLFVSFLQTKKQTSTHQLDASLDNPARYYSAW